jgi:hypothetical protein
MARGHARCAPKDEDAFPVCELSFKGGADAATVTDRELR